MQSIPKDFEEQILLKNSYNLLSENLRYVPEDFPSSMRSKSPESLRKSFEVASESQEGLIYREQEAFDHTTALPVLSNVYML